MMMHHSGLATNYVVDGSLQSSYSSPTLSASSSTPFIPLVPFHSLDSSSSHGGETALVVGSRIRMRGAEFLPSKLAHYAHTLAEVAQLPSHPNTWFEIKLQDGKQVKMRKTAFVEAMGASNEPSNNNNVATLNAYNLQQHQMQFQQPPPLHSFASPYSSSYTQQHHQQHQQVSQLSLPQQQNKMVMHPQQQQQSYFSPSPTSSATHSPALSSSSVPVPFLSKLTLDQHSTNAVPASVPASATKMPSAAAATNTTGVNLPQAPAQTEQRMSTDSHSQHSSESAGSGSEHEDHEEEALTDGRSRGVSLATTTDDGTSSTGGAGAAQSAQSLVLNSKRKPVPRALSPEADPNDSDDAGTDHEDQEDEEDDDHDEDHEEEDEDDPEDDGSHSRASSSKKSSSRAKSGGGAKSSAGAKNANGSKSARSRRGRGRALLGLNVVVLGGRYLGETGLVVRGANGYYSVKFHRPMSDLRAPGLDNTAMKRSSELAPINASGKRLQLPLPPAQRKIMKQEAEQGVGRAAAAVAMNSVKRPSASAEASSSSPSLVAASSSPGGGASNKRKIAFPVSSRRTAVYRRRESAASKVNQHHQQQHESDTDSHSDCSSSSSRSGSPTLESAAGSGSDGEGRRHNARGRRGHSDWHRHRHAAANVNNNHHSDESVSPARTVLLSPMSFPPSPSVHGLPTPISCSARSPGSLLYHQSSSSSSAAGFLAPMSLPPTHFHQEPAAEPKSKSANMRAPSPGIKQAACILLALSHEGEEGSGASLPADQQQPMQITYSLTHIKPHPVTDDPQLEGVLYTGVPWTM